MANRHAEPFGGEQRNCVKHYLNLPEHYPNTSVQGLFRNATVRLGKRMVFVRRCPLVCILCFAFSPAVSPLVAGAESLAVAATPAVAAAPEAAPTAAPEAAPAAQEAAPKSAPEAA